MKMEHLSISWFKQGDAETSVYCARKGETHELSGGSMRPWFHLNPSAPAPAPNKLRPSVPEETFEGSRVKGKTTDYSMKLWHMWQRPRVKKLSVTLITNLTAEPVRLRCSHRNLNVSIHDGSEIIYLPYVWFSAVLKLSSI